VSDKTKTEVLVVLADGETYTNAEGCFFVDFIETRPNALAACDDAVIEGGIATLAALPDQTVHLGDEEEHGLIFERRAIRRVTELDKTDDS